MYHQCCWLCVCVCVCVYVCVCVCVCAQIHACMYARLFGCHLPLLLFHIHVCLCVSASVTVPEPKRQGLLKKAATLEQPSRVSACLGFRV